MTKGYILSDPFFVPTAKICCTLSNAIEVGW